MPLLKSHLNALALNGQRSFDIEVEETVIYELTVDATDLETAINNVHTLFLDDERSELREAHEAIHSLITSPK